MHYLLTVFLGTVILESKSIGQLHLVARSKSMANSDALKGHTGNLKWVMQVLNQSGEWKGQVPGGRGRKQILKLNTEIQDQCCYIYRLLKETEIYIYFLRHMTLNVSSGVSRYCVGQ